MNSALKIGATAAACVLLLAACGTAPAAKPAASPQADEPARPAAQAAAPDASAAKDKPAATAAPSAEPPAPAAQQPAKPPASGGGAEGGSGSKPSVPAPSAETGGSKPSVPAEQPAAAKTDKAPASAAKPKESNAAAKVDKKALSWYYMKKLKGQVPGFPAETKQFSPDMKALWVGTGKKVYLTIDTGGPLGDTDLLVKSLKDNGVKANFFIAGYNVKKNPAFIRQLAADGHLIANHTMTHTDMNTQTDDEVRKEIKDYEKLIQEVTGQPIVPFFRFPYGKYNTHLLKMVSDMGYTSVFWSTAMRDWEPRKNGAEDPYNDIMNNLHDGNIILMHQGSPENLQALDRIVKAVKNAGYEFALLTDIQPPK